MIIPVYNRQNFILTAVDSVLSQTYQNFELIIIDDGSTDRTSEKVKSVNDPRIRYSYQKNQGPASARNKGITLSRSVYTAFLDSDDRWLPEKLARQVDFMEKHDQAMICHTEETWFKNGKILLPKPEHKKNQGNIFLQSLKLCAVSMSTVMVRTGLFGLTGNFDPDMTVCEDYDFWLRVSARYPVYLIDEALTEKEGGHADQLSGRYPGMDRFRIRAIRKILCDPHLIPEQVGQALRVLCKKCRVYGLGCLNRGKRNEGMFYLTLYDREAKKHVRP